MDEHYAYSEEIGGWPGMIGPVEPASGQAEIVLDSGPRLLVSAAALIEQPNGSLFLPAAVEGLGLPAAAAGPAQSHPEEAVTIPVLQEQVHVEKYRRETGRVVVHVVPQTHKEPIDVSLMQEQVEVERVPLNQVVAEPPAIREEGDVTIVPVIEEVLVVEKRLMLKEEIRITRRRTTRHERQEVLLRSEEAEVYRRDA